MQTIIEPNLIKLENNILSFIDKETLSAKYKITNFTPDQEELIANECSSREEFFDHVHSPLIKNVLELNDLEIEILKSWLSENSLL